MSNRTAIANGADPVQQQAATPPRNAQPDSPSLDTSSTGVSESALLDSSSEAEDSFFAAFSFCTLVRAVAYREQGTQFTSL